MSHFETETVWRCSWGRVLGKENNGSVGRKITCDFFNYWLLLLFWLLTLISFNVRYFALANITGSVTSFVLFNFSLLIFPSRRSKKQPWRKSCSNFWWKCSRWEQCVVFSTSPCTWGEKKRWASLFTTNHR